MERPPKKYVCEKCGYLGDTPDHEGCDYLAWTTGEQLYIDQLEMELALLKASPVGAPEVRESVIEAIAEALGDAYDCTRVWSAWSYGTMSQDDFSLVAEDRSRLEEIADAAMLAAAPTPPVSEDRWLPIATAPKETTQMFVVVAFGAKVGATPYNSDPWCVWHQRGEFVRWPHKFSPTHWMPLPEAPAMQEDKP